MKNHTKIYLESFGYDIGISDIFVPSEISEERSVDIHHIIGRGKGGDDRIENLMALTRQEHIGYGDKKEYMALLFKIHLKRLEIANIPFDKEWITRQIQKYNV